MKEGNLTPATQKPLNRWSPKFVSVIMLRISTTVPNFIQIGLGVTFLRMRDFAPLGTKWLGYFFFGGGSWERSPPRCAHRFSAQGSAFWGSRNQHTISKWKIPLFPPLQCSAETLIRLPFSPKNRHFEAIFRRDEIYSPENGFNIRRLESKRPLIVVGAQ